MPDDRKAPETAAPVERRVAALEQAFAERNLMPAGFIDDFTHVAQEDWVPANGAKVVARAWTDPDFKQRLLAGERSNLELDGGHVDADFRQCHCRTPPHFAM